MSIAIVNNKAKWIGKMIKGDKYTYLKKRSALNNETLRYNKEYVAKV